MDFISLETYLMSVQKQVSALPYGSIFNPSLTIASILHNVQPVIGNVLWDDAMPRNSQWRCRTLSDNDLQGQGSNVAFDEKCNRIRRHCRNLNDIRRRPC